MCLAGDSLRLAEGLADLPKKLDPKSRTGKSFARSKIDALGIGGISKPGIALLCDSADAEANEDELVG